MKTQTQPIVHIKARAFTGGRVSEQRCMVELNGTVRVWDSVAGYYTTCHTMSKASQDQARHLAKQGLEDGTICRSCGGDPCLCECPETAYCIGCVECDTPCLGIDEVARSTREDGIGQCGCCHQNFGEAENIQE